MLLVADRAQRAAGQVEQAARAKVGVLRGGRRWRKAVVMRRMVRLIGGGQWLEVGVRRVRLAGMAVRLVLVVVVLRFVVRRMVVVMVVVVVVGRRIGGGGRRIGGIVGLKRCRIIELCQRARGAGGWRLRARALTCARTPAGRRTERSGLRDRFVFRGVLGKQMLNQRISTRSGIVQDQRSGASCPGANYNRFRLRYW